MLDPGVSVRIQEIIGNNKCKCGKKAERFKQIAKTSTHYYCNFCFDDLMGKEQAHTILPCKFFEKQSEPFDSDNMPDLFWAPPIKPR